MFTGQVWLDAFLATGIISILPNLFLFFIPANQLILVKNVKSKINLGNILLFFAVAGLLGDVFLHMLPHLFGDGHHHHGDEHNHKEQVQANEIPHSHQEVHHEEHHHEDHSHAHHEGHDHHHDSHHHPHEIHSSHESIKSCSPSFFQSILLQIFTPDVVTSLLSKSMLTQLAILLGFFTFFIIQRFGDSNSHYHDHSHKKDSPQKKESNEPKKNNDSSGSFFSKLTITGWLNLIADSLHNFTDGLAIGASFASGRGLALATFISVILHEVPHEIGDFSILINNGLSKFEAIKAQFGTAIAAFLGTFCGLLVHKDEFLENILLAFTAGGFLYIATVSILPMILANQATSNIQIFLEIISFVLGIGMMIMVTFFE